VVELVVVRAGVEGGCGGGVATVEIVVVVHLVRTMPVPPTARPGLSEWSNFFENGSYFPVANVTGMHWD